MSHSAGWRSSGGTQACWRSGSRWRVSARSQGKTTSAGRGVPVPRPRRRHRQHRARALPLKQLDHRHRDPNAARSDKPRRAWPSSWGRVSVPAIEGGAGRTVSPVGHRAAQGPGRRLQVGHRLVRPQNARQYGVGLVVGFSPPTPDPTCDRWENLPSGKPGRASNGGARARGSTAS